MRTRIVKLFFISVTCFGIARADDAAPKIQWGFYLDTSYAFDSNRPTNRERLYTTLPVRHNEFTVNLVYLEAKITAPNWRSRVALQTGASVAANYAAEFRDKTKAGSQLADYLSFVQEAYAGYFVANRVWVDAGIYFSHIGSESFISRDNPTYTRSLVADFTPYYQAGVRASYHLNSQWAFQLHVVNGWQNIVETNDSKSVGTQITFTASSALSIAYNTLLGNEAAFRLFHDFIFKYKVSPFWEITLVADFGTQDKVGGPGTLGWGGTALLQRFTVSPLSKVGVRAEYYTDKNGVIVPTGTAGGFQVWGASVNLDYQLTPELLFRNEVRYQRATDAIFPARGNNQPETLLGVSSVALSL